MSTTQGYFMASIDPRDAYYSLPIYEEHKNLIRFDWYGQGFWVVCSTKWFGLRTPSHDKAFKAYLRVFDKSKKSIFHHLHCMTRYWQNKQSRNAYLETHASCFAKMGFVIHLAKSILKPSQKMQYLGVIINSEIMAERVNILKADCEKRLKGQVMTVREVAQVTGKMVYQLSSWYKTRT